MVIGTELDCHGRLKPWHLADLERGVNVQLIAGGEDLGCNQDHETLPLLSWMLAITNILV